MKSLTDFAPDIFKTAPVIILLLDNNGMVVDVNSYFETLTGFTPSEAQGKNWIDSYIPARDRQSILSIFNAAIHGNPVRGHINPILTHSGDEIYIEWYSENLYDDNGNHLGHLAIGQDVSKRIKYEQEIKNMALIIDNSMDFIGIADIEGNSLFLNQGGRKLVGITSDEQFHSTRVLDYFPEPEKQIAQSEIIPTVLQQGRWAGDFTFKHFQTGEHIPVWFDIFRVDDPNTGEPTNLATNTRDLRLQKETEANLEETRRLHEQAQEIAHLGFLRVIPDTRQVTCSDELLRIFELPKAIDTIDSILNATHPDDREIVFQAYYDGATKGENKELSYRIICPSGIEKWVHIKGEAIIDDNGKAVELIGIFQDITQQKTIELELENHKNNLEKIVYERTEELVKARNEAQEANRAKSEFLSRMSHELRTPLNAIIGFSQLFLMDAHELSGEQQEHIHQISNAGYHLLDLINGLLDLASIESGKFDLDMDTVNACTVLQHCIDLTQSQANEKGIQVENHAQTRCNCLIHASQTHLRQIFINLISNAIKYNKRNGKIIIDCQNPSADKVRFSITDTGRGIPANDLSSVFDPFQRASNRGVTEGTGIGLAITKHLIELMGGSISIKSSSDQGTTFEIEFNASHFKP